MIQAMGHTAVGAYLMELRERRRPKMSRARLADLVGTTAMNISRIERGQEPGGELLVRLVTTLNGSWDTVTQLMLSDDMSDPDIQALVDEQQRRMPGSLSDEIVFNRLLDLLESGVDPAEAVRRARRG